MTDKEAKQTGGMAAIKSLLPVVLIAELYWMIKETKGDFANGILFFISYHTNIFIILFYASLFVSTWLFGQNAGKELIIQKKNKYLIAIKYSVLTTLILFTYAFLTTIITHADINVFFMPALVVFLLLSIVWLWTVRRIGIKGLTQNTGTL